MPTLMRSLLLGLFLVACIVISSPPAARAQQGGGGLYVLPSWTYTVAVGQKSPYSDDLESGCWGNYGNQWPMGSTPDSPRWGFIDADGNIRGGCHIAESTGQNSSSRLIQGMLTGTFSANSQSIDKFHLETSETTTITDTGKISVGTTTIVVDASGGPVIPPSPPATHQVSGRFTLTYQSSELSTPQKMAGTVIIPLSINIQVATIDLSISQADIDSSKPFAYNPYSFRIKLRKPKGDGTFEPMPGEIVRLAPDPWNTYNPVFSQGFQASNCTNCGTQDVDGVKVTFIQDVTQPILLKTDANGEATIALYLDMARLDEFGLAPTLDTALTTTFHVSYEFNNQVLAKADTTVSLKTIGVVEKVDYIPPVLLDRNTGLPGLRQPQPLASYTKENGDACAQDIAPSACGLDRVKIRHENATWFAPPELATTPGETLKPGALVAASDEIRIDVCDLPNLDRLLKENPNSGPIEISYPAEIAVQIRFFDGVRGKFSVNETVRERSYDFWVERGTIIPYVSVKQFCGSRLLIAPFISPNNKTTGQKVMEKLGLPMDPAKMSEWVTEQMMDTVVETVFPVYTKTSGIAKKISTIFGYIQTVMNSKAVYTQVKSNIYAQSGLNGVTVTTRQGEPILFTSATGAEGVAVPSGQTATIPDSLIPQLQNTDAETAKRADSLLASMQPDETGLNPSGSEPAVPVQPPDSTAGALALILCGGVPLIGLLGLIGGVVLFTRSRRHTAKPSAPPPAVPGHATPSGFTCTRCGTSNRAAARFCAQCGTPRQPSKPTTLPK